MWDQVGFFSHVEAENLKLFAESRQLREECEFLREERDRYRADLRQAEFKLREVSRRPTETQLRLPRPTRDDPGLKRPHDAVRVAMRRYVDVLIFLNSAQESAANSPFRRPHNVYHVLQTLGELGRKWRANHGCLGKDWVKAFAEYGITYKPHISQTAATNHRDHYLCDYIGEKLLFENHVTLGIKSPDTCLSIHWYRDDDNRVLVVGWCGKHLRSTRS